MPSLFALGLYNQKQAQKTQPPHCLLFQNDETYFREFVARFVDIWRSQLQLDFQSDDCPLWHEVQPDNGPHLGRLPDELLPAIGKFIIVARDACENDSLTEEGIEQVAILIDCLVIVCRHFDNILAIIKYEYKPNLIAILSKLFTQVRRHKNNKENETEMIIR